MFKIARRKRWWIRISLSAITIVVAIARIFLDHYWENEPAAAQPQVIKETIVREVPASPPAYASAEDDHNSFLDTIPLPQSEPPVETQYEPNEDKEDVDVIQFPRSRYIFIPSGKNEQTDQKEDDVGRVYVGDLPPVDQPSDDLSAEHSEKSDRVGISYRIVDDNGTIRVYRQTVDGRARMEITDEFNSQEKQP